MQFGVFTEANHCCDALDCKAALPARSLGWHCEICDVDFCTACQYPDFDISAYLESSLQSSLDDSIGAMQLNSASPVRTQSPAAPSRQQEDNAAALGRGHNA
jgi:hypothetical protein